MGLPHRRRPAGRRGLEPERFALPVDFLDRINEQSAGELVWRGVLSRRASRLGLRFRTRRRPNFGWSQAFLTWPSAPFFGVCEADAAERLVAMNNSDDGIARDRPASHC